MVSSPSGIDLDGRVSELALKQQCKDAVLLIFPDICHDYLEQISSQHSHNFAAVVDAVLLRQEKGDPYPVKARDNPLKRKRADDTDDDDDDDDEEKVTGAVRENATEKFAKEMRTQIHAPNRKAARDTSITYTKMAVEFPTAPVKVIRGFLRDHANLLFDAYAAMDDIVRNPIRNPGGHGPGWQEKKKLSKRLPKYLPDQIQNLDMAQYDVAQKEAIAELRAARELSALKNADAAAEALEKAEFERAKSTGLTIECGCCFDEFMIDQMIQCEGESVHYFCRRCIIYHAETVIGLSNYELKCFSMDGCDAGFSRAQKNLFLNKKLRTALDRFEQEAELRSAGIEDLETCPFCPYAAEYPPTSVDKEFRCIRPGCHKVSCRLCRKESHIPKSCDEAASDNGISKRHEVEEAMTAAIVRNCNNCKNAFVKLDGCNKIVCTKCRAIQCYVCRETITSYAHFNDVARGGQKGRCPLYDDTEARHEGEVQRAEEEARQKVAQANPDIAADALKLNVSEVVQQDELRRKQSSTRPNFPARRQVGVNNAIENPRLNRGRAPQHAGHIERRVPDLPAQIAPQNPPNYPQEPANIVHQANLVHQAQLRQAQLRAQLQHAQWQQAQQQNQLQHAQWQQAQLQHRQVIAHPPHPPPPPQLQQALPPVLQHPVYDPAMLQFQAAQQQVQQVQQVQQALLQGQPYRVQAYQVPRQGQQAQIPQAPHQVPPRAPRPAAQLRPRKDPK